MGEHLGRKHPVFPPWAPASYTPSPVCHWPCLDHPLLPSRAVLPHPSPVSPSSPLEGWWASDCDEELALPPALRDTALAQGSGQSP